MTHETWLAILLLGLAIVGGGGGKPHPRPLPALQGGETKEGPARGIDLDGR